MHKHIIVGIDPGTTTAVVSLDLDGEIVDIKSQRSFSIGLIVSHLKDIGLPMIVATDRENVPKKVEKVAVSFPAKIFHPEESMRRKEKAEIIRSLGHEWNNQHEKDAAAAAIMAYNFYKPTIAKVKRRLDTKGLSSMKGKIASEVILKRKNIEKAVKDLPS